VKIDTDKLLTPEEAGERIGANKRAVYRALKRARAAGKQITVELFGRTLVPVENVEALREFYYPYYSEAHQKKVKEWGAAGGNTRWAKARAAKRGGRP
jgi:selenocysteine lyase/cysteine desulfurase